MEASKKRSRKLTISDMYEGTPSDIRKTAALLGRMGYMQANSCHPMREGFLYRLEFDGHWGYNIWDPGIRAVKSLRPRRSAWDLNSLDVLRKAHPAAFRGLCHAAASSVRDWHIENAIETVCWRHTDDVERHVWELFNTPVLDEDSGIDGAEMDLLNRLRYIVAIFAVYAAGFGYGQKLPEKRPVYKLLCQKARKSIRRNRKYFLPPLL